jgi:hypothetical protein
MIDLKKKQYIQEIINDFGTGIFAENAVKLCNILGYQAGKQNLVFEKTVLAFCEHFDPDDRLNPEKARISEWQSIDLLFRFTADFLSDTGHSSCEKYINGTIVESWFFFAIELTRPEYSRTILAQITREMTKIFQMPFLIIFKYGTFITLSIPNQYVSKINKSETIPEKVFLIKDISIMHPHWAHIDILSNLSLYELQRHYTITNFAELYRAWEIVLDVKELNRRFYREIAQWYFWALHSVTFPQPVQPVPDHTAKSLIRLLIRLLFVWFVKEKGLIGPDLFNKKYLAGLLKHFDPNGTGGIENNVKGSAYYRAILQNLFFATLNQEQNLRGFHPDYQHCNMTILFQYENYFTDTQEFIYQIQNIPFMNDSLFDCLDKVDSIEHKRIYEDGFSNQIDNVLCVPDYLFFGEKETNIFGESDDISQRKSPANGIINIFEHYKFTMTENTLLEEDVALDPELLGQVFENLLANYHLGTKITARKQTGSFYTPREIVDYMVNESLKVYFSKKLENYAGLSEKLAVFFSYTDTMYQFTDKEVRILIDVLDQCRILDPACGSGAFLMGVLQKLVFILQKLDPKNKYWWELQKQKVLQNVFTLVNYETREERLKEIDTVFENNTSDYSRKLYLMENSIYGVDIQPIAIQISKLRFFISLIIEQKSDPAQPNSGVHPLPNLETKFIAANTLIGINQPVEYLSNEKFNIIVEELCDIRRRLFSVKIPQIKEKFQSRDKELRITMQKELLNINEEENSIVQMSVWDPYNQDISAGWFDPKWMFGIKTGFDVVIGNPPYGGSYPNDLPYYFRKTYKSAQTIPNKQKGSIDTFSLFIEQGYNLLKIGAGLHYIVPLSVTSSESMSGLHNILLNNCQKIKISSYADRPKQIFQNAAVGTAILFFLKTETKCESLLTTKVNRWHKKITLKQLIDTLHFTESLKYYFYGRLPKIGLTLESTILDKVFSSQNIAIKHLERKDGAAIYYRIAGGRYFKIITNYSTGSTQEKVVFLDRKLANSIGAILSSNLFFWFYQVFSDNHGIKLHEIELFKIPVKNLTDEFIIKLDTIYLEYLIDIEKNTIEHFTTAYANINSFKEYKIFKSKHLIDQLDDLICPLYGLTSEEIEFIKNYEIEFRLGELQEI